MAENTEGKAGDPKPTEVRKNASPPKDDVLSIKDDPKLATYRSFLEAQLDKRSIENSLLTSIIIFGVALFITFPTIAQKLQGLEREDDVIEIIKQTVIQKPQEDVQHVREVKQETRQRDFTQIPALSRPTGREEIVEDITDLDLAVNDELTDDFGWDLDNVQAPGPILVAGDITPPQFIARGQKPYPQKARILRRTGTVRIEVIVAKDGTLEDIKILEENPPDFDFGDAAVTYLKQGEWKPALQNGKPIYARYIFTFQFTLN
jgi:TonB family protein